MLCAAQQGDQQTMNIVARREKCPLVIRVAIQEPFLGLELREIVPGKRSTGHSSAPSCSVSCRAEVVSDVHLTRLLAASHKKRAGVWQRTSVTQQGVDSYKSSCFLT